jgi:hypothetical protein
MPLLSTLEILCPFYLPLRPLNFSLLRIMSKILCIFFFLATISLSGQVAKKTLEPLKTKASAQIDGVLNDSIWAFAPVATDFVMLSPGSGTAIPSKFSTSIKIFYTDEAIYLGASMRDPSPDSILTQVAARDNYNQNNDWIAVAINPFNDGQNDFSFFITAAGLQADSRTTGNGEDFSLNSIWKSAVQINDSGWTAEIKIPYISLRFPTQLSKDWGFNVIRNVRRSRKEYSWNFIDRASGYSYEYQAGILKNIRDIKPPVRFSLMPYASSYVDNFNGNTAYNFNAGVDLKYGINESFTLDATLIPDFGQVPFDQQVLNLSPFENRFQENRQFFNEGTELFSIGDIFYSRRIGGAPDNITNADLAGNDSTNVTVKTEFTRILNATKISGRTNGNLGIGFLNAITDNNYSTVDSAWQESQELLAPLTNYNVLVLDQRINRASSVSLINTNVMRQGEYVDGNVVGLLASIYSPSGLFRTDAQIKRSDRFHSSDSTETGHNFYLRFGDVAGNWRWATKQEVFTDNYNPNDLGLLPRNNLIRNYSEVEYATFKPKGRFNRFSLTLFSVYSTLYKPQRFEEFYLGFNSFFLLRDFTGTGIRLRLRPQESFDYFEARTPGRYFSKPVNYAISYFISTDYRKPFALDLDFDYDHSFDWNRDHYTINVEPRIRLGDHFFIIPQATFDLFYNDRGFAGFGASETPVFGNRNVQNLTALIDGRYAFNPNSSLGLRLRQYWSRVEYDQYYNLEANGGLSANDNADNFDLFFNTLNLDLRFSWWFAPASEMVILYRVALSNKGSAIEDRYFGNLDQALAAPVQNNISIRLSYFLDYNRTQKAIAKRRK